MKNKVWLNNKFIDADKAKVSIFDRGFMYGDGVFETMRCYAGIVFKLDEHLKRLYVSLSMLGIKPPCGMTRLKMMIYKTLKVNKLTSAYIKVSVTRGEGRFGIGYKDEFSPNTVIVTKNFEGYPDWMFDKGLSACVTDIRQNEYSMLSRVKSLNFLTYIIARFEAKKKGYDEAILANTRGHITEAATSNVFLVKNGAIVTPLLSDGVLPGVTRATVIAIAGKLGLRVKEKTILYKDLLDADEVFFTNSLAEILPVTKIGQKKIGKGSPGSITKLLRIFYQKETPLR